MKDAARIPDPAASGLTLPCHPEPVGCHPEPVGCHPEPVGCHPEPVGCHPEPVGCHPEPVEGRLVDGSDTEERAIARYVMNVVMPLWIASGSIDYVLHKRSKIEATSGTYESVLHAAGISMSAVPVLAGLFLEVDAGVLLAMIAGYVAHAGMTIWDVAYASEKRDVVPTEQHVHGMLEFLPFAALSFMLVAYRRQALALVGRGSGERPRFAFRRKRAGLPAAPVAATIAAFTAFVAVPYAEELARCLRYERPHSGC